jgi:polyhydroxyalkanoate synthase
MQGADPDAWLATAEQQQGSWWPHWRSWLARFGGTKRDAPAGPGNEQYPAIEPAPGRYVLEKA